MISDNDVSYFFDHSLYFIFLKIDGDLDIFIDNIVMDMLSILFQEVLGPDHLGQYIVHSNRLGLS